LTGAQRSWPLAPPLPFCLRFRPDGQQLAVPSGPGKNVRVYETDSGALIASLPHNNIVRRVDWSPDGRWLAAPCDDARVYLWDMGRGGILDTQLSGHDHVVTSVCFDPQGEFLVSQAWDGTSCLWSLPLRSLLFRLPGCDYPLSFSADGNRLGPFVFGQMIRLFEVARAPACRVLPANQGNQANNGAFSPDSRWAVLGGEAGLQCWDSRNGQLVWTLPMGYVRWVLFHPDGRRLLTFDETGPREWPWSVDAATAVPQLGKPNRLPAGPTSEAQYSRDGTVLVMSQYEGLRVFDARKAAPSLLAMPMCNFATVSPDGRFAAASPWGRSDMKVWELPAGREVFRFTNVNPALAFSGDSRWLLMAWGFAIRCLESGTWRTAVHLPQDPIFVAHLAVSPDGRWAAFDHTMRRQLQFCELPSLRPFLELDAASESPVCVSPDGALLLTRRPHGQFALWDLRRVREALTPLGLGW
jgi:WD40 repeat protein